MEGLTGLTGIVIGYFILLIMFLTAMFALVIVVLKRIDSRLERITKILKVKWDVIFMDGDK